MSTSSRSVKDKQELLQEHFVYEVQMLQGILLYRDMIAMPDIDPQFKDNVILEMFLLHARILYEFFYHDRTPSDYARAHQFFKERNAWKKLRPQKTAAIKELEARVSVELSHLTYRRISGQPPQKSWELSAPYKDLMNVVGVFLTNVSPHYLDEYLMLLRETAGRPSA